ncbi:Beta-galactosidase [bioreactor metagenome]|uniref:Beta-galactosidase n=1 Tax=bioreactor metagenome TaxID=1076179 RepID=A0A644W6S0_9ZZZZ
MRIIHVNGVPEGSMGRAEISIPFIDASKINTGKVWFYAEISEENQKTSNVIFKGKLKGSVNDGIFKSTLNLKNVKLWHFDDPNLYKINVVMYEGKTAKDELSTVFGFRSIKVENNRYILNGEPVRLIGMEWTAGENMEMGLAQTKENIDKGLTLMKNANCVFARCHWQQSDYFFDWCDRHGILVMEEVPLWGWETPLNDTLLPVAMRHLDEMIDAHYNHPSIIIWGLGNELDSHKETNIKGLDAMEKHARNLDPSRIVAYISNAVQWKGLEVPDASPRYDMIMYNEYNTTWYGNNLDSIPVALDRIHDMYPDKPVTISEWGICEPRFTGGDERRATEMAEQIKIYSSKDYVAGAVYFCLNDYRTHMGEDSLHKYPVRVHGICDINLNKKDSYDVMKEISSPLVISDVIVEGNQVSMTIECRDAIPSYTVRNYYILADDTRIDIRKMSPGQKINIDFTTSAFDLVIYRPTGFEVLRIGIK